MDKAARNKVCLALRKKLKDPSGRCYVSKHPVLALWRSSDLAICKAIVECFAQYTNLPDRLDAEDLKQKGGIELIRISDELIKKHSDTVDTAFRELLMHIARSVESLGENPKKDALLELCLKVVLVRRIDQPNFSKKPPNLSKTILNNDKYCDLLVDFLDATDQIAIELNAEFQIKKLDEPLFLAGYIRVHLDGERRRNSLLNCTGKDFEYLQNIDVQELAQKACLLEFNFESQHGRKLPFPFSYLQPFALTPEDLTGVNIRSRHYIRFRPSYYAARLACAALMMSNSSEGDHECNRSLLRLFLLPHAEREKVYSPKQLPNLSGASGTAKSVFNYFGTENKKAGGKEATYLYSLSTEYDSA
jgi:DnaJ-domain-containing protein 1